MTHPHSDQRSATVSPHPRVFMPYQHLVNAPVSPLDPRASAHIPPHYSASPTVVDGTVIASTVSTPAHLREDTDRIIGEGSKRSLLRRAIEDPYWILMTLMAVLGLSITATVVYGIIQITLAIGRWFTTNGTTLGTIAALVILVMLCGGTSAAKCVGIHCGGCRR
jgi:hypothetical protein